MLLQVLCEFGPRGGQEFVEGTARQGEGLGGACDRIGIDVVEVQRKAFVVGEMVHGARKIGEGFAVGGGRRRGRLVMLAVVASVAIHACEFGCGGFVMGAAR